MKKNANRLRVTLTLIFTFCLTPHLFSSEWSYITEGGDWAQKQAEAEAAWEKVRQEQREQTQAVRIKMAENPVPGESEEEATTRIIMAESQALEQERQKIEQERQAREDAEFNETLRLSGEQAELENRQRAEREEQERLEREEKDRQDRERQEQEEQEGLERERVIAQEKTLAEQKEKIAQEQRQQEREAKALADVLRQEQEREDEELATSLAASMLKKSAQSTPSKYRPDEPLEDINKELEKFEQVAYEQELKQSAPFFQSYEQAISPENEPRINIIRPEVIQQKDLECGYYSAINGALLYNAFRSRTSDALWIMLAKLKNRKEIARLLKKAQDKLGCPQTLEDYQIIEILAKYYQIPLESGVYSMYYEQLPDNITKLDKLNQPIIATLEKLATQKGFTHIFFLRKSGAHAGKANLGHWISVVAHNNDNKSIDLYVLDSQYPQGNSASDRNHRMNHDKMWQALAILLHETSEKLREEQPD